MQFTHEHEELKRNLQRFIVDEINPHVDEWEAAEIFPAHEVFVKAKIKEAIWLKPPLAPEDQS
jgi:alkylation response protein AidB-like acyl-CoA dehydrogenase